MVARSNLTVVPLTDPAAVYVPAIAVPEILPVEKSSDLKSTVSWYLAEPTWLYPSQCPRTSTGPAAMTADAVNATKNPVARTHATTRLIPAPISPRRPRASARERPGRYYPGPLGPIRDAPTAPFSSHGPRPCGTELSPAQQAPTSCRRRQSAGSLVSRKGRRVGDYATPTCSAARTIISTEQRGPTHPRHRVGLHPTRATRRACVKSLRQVLAPSPCVKSSRQVRDGPPRGLVPGDSGTSSR